MEAKIIGLWDYGACGMVPLIAVPRSKPRLKNNGYNCYGGHGPVDCPGLFAALPDEGRTVRQGHVMLTYTDGSRFGTYAAVTAENESFIPH